MSTTTKIPIAGGEAAYVRRGTGPCQVHDFSDDELPTALMELARRTHPLGINVCRDCIKRARASLDARQRRRGTRA